MKWALALATTCALALAQQPPSTPADASEAEKAEIGRGLAEANNSPVEILHVVATHLERYPNSVYRPELEHRAAEAAISLHDDALVVRYGEMSLARIPDDMKLLPAVTRSLLALDSRETVERALKYARHAEDLARQYRKGANPPNVSPVEWRNQTDRALGRALTDDARATGILGHPQEALATAQRAFETFPNADSASEVAFWFERTGKLLDAARALADAFTIPDAQATDAERAHDRQRMAELYRKAKGSDKHLGDLTLEAYDRNVALLQARDLHLHQDEPNSGLTDPMAFTLSTLGGTKLEIASLKGKVLVLDIWATWCVPCREQHPLYEQVKERFRDNPAVVFLSINADSDHEPVKSFVSALHWEGPIYFEDGLLRVFAVENMPTTLVLDRQGKVFTRMNGYVKEHFADLLTDRIREALAAPVAPVKQ
jgi:thiol-disulfide isomerase/thioredoxin